MGIKNAEEESKLFLTNSNVTQNNQAFLMNQEEFQWRRNVKNKSIEMTLDL